VTPGWKRAIGVGAAVAGATSAAAAGGLAAQRTMASRRATRGEQHHFGTLRAEPHTVVADDGVPLHVEVDEPDQPDPDAPTVVFVHGYVVDLDCWHFQRLALRGRYRMVFYDQRSHGRSGRSTPAHSTIEQLGRDLATVLAEEVPTGPVVLVGHSMGGMSLMSFAEQFPEVVAERVVGVAFLATSSGGVAALLPGAPGRVLDRAQPLLAAALARLPWLVETGRRTAAFALTRQLAFGGEVPESYVVFVDEMIAKTPSDVIWDFFPSFRHHLRERALATYANLPSVVIGGELDHVLPVGHTERIARALPRSRLFALDGAGHMVMLERQAEVTEAVEELLREAAAEVRARRRPHRRPRRRAAR